MATFTQTSFPASQSPLSEAGKWQPYEGTTGVSTDGAGNVKSSTAGWQATRLAATEEAFGEYLYAEVTVGTESGSIGVAAWSTAASGWGGIGVTMTAADTLLIREYGDAEDISIYSTLAEVYPSLAAGSRIGLEITENVAANTANYAVRVNDTSVQTGTISKPDALNIQPGFIGQNDSAGTLTAITARDTFVIPPTGLTVDAIPATAARAQTGLEITVSNASAGATTGNTTLQFDDDTGPALTVTAVTYDDADTVTVTFTVPVDVDKKHDATGYPLYLDLNGETVTSDDVPLTAQSGYTTVDQVDPVASADTVWSEIDTAPATGAQVVYQSSGTTSGDAVTVTVDAQGYVEYDPAPTADVSFQAYSISADGTYNDDATTITFTVAANVAPVPSTTRRGKLTVLQNSGGQIAVDGTVSGTSVPLYLSVWNELGLAPNGEPIDTVVLSGSNFYNRLGEQLTPGPVYVGPNKRLTSAPNGEPIGTII